MSYDCRPITPQILDTFISSALGELGHDLFLLKPEDRHHYMRTIMLELIQLKHAKHEAVKSASAANNRAFDLEKKLLQISSCLERDDDRRGWFVADRTANTVNLSMQDVRAMTDSPVKSG